MKYILTFFLAATLFACNFQPTPIDIEIDEPPQKLVISSFFVPIDSFNDVMTITLTRTFTALVDDDSLDLQDSTNSGLIDRVFVEDALLRLEHQGVEFEFGEVAPAVYTSAEIDFNFHDMYKLYAKDILTEEEITAETQLLPPVEYENISVRQELLPSFDDTLYNVDIQFSDIPNEENYYLITYTDLSNFDAGGLGSNIFSQASSNFSVLSDAEYGDGSQIDFTVGSPGEAGDTLIFGLSNITKGYFEYLSAYRRSGNVLTQLTGEPINLPTNVVNGFGYFAIIWPKLEVVVLE